MKLNLAPRKAKKEGSLAGAWVFSGLFVLLAAGASAFMAFESSRRLDAAKARAEEIRPRANQAVAQAKLANAIVASTAGVTRNLELSRAMSAHNSKYPRFYRQILPYIPGFLRVTRLQATPANSTRVTLTINGVIYSLQQHTDAQLALLRIPGAVSSVGTGYTPRPVLIPALNEEDQIGRPARVGSTPAPEDPLERLNALISTANAQTVGFENIGNFGTDASWASRGPLPTGAEVVYTVVLDAAASGAPLPAGFNIDLMVPEPTATLNQAAGAPGAIPTAAPAAAGGFPAATSGLAPGEDR